MANDFSTTSGAQSATIGALLTHDEFVETMTTTDRMLVLQRLSATMAYLADQARDQRRHGLEKTLLKTAAEVLTSASEIATASYAPLLIQRLILKIDEIEDRLMAQGNLVVRSEAH
jgi:hypothetical protein